MLRSFASWPGRALRAVGAFIRRLANADTALWLGWAMATTGFAQKDVAIGLIVGGVALVAGALFVARGDE